MASHDARRQLVDLTRNLLRRELRSRYKRSTLGWTWSLINPLASVAIYSLVFSFFDADVPVGDPSGLHTFPLFLLCGLVPWTFFANSVSTSTEALVGNASIIKKVYFRRDALVFAQTGSAAVTSLIELGVLLVILLLAGNMVLPWLPAVALLFALQALLVTGVSLIVSVLNVYLRDVKHFVAVALQLGFYATPIIYQIDLVPKRQQLLGVDVPLRALFELNPITAFIGAYRNVLYDLRFPAALDLLYLAAWALGALWIGWRVFAHFEPRLAEEL